MAETMPQHHPNQVPPVLLRGAAVLIVGAILAIGAARLMGLAPAAMPPDGQAAAERSIAILREDGGGVRVINAATGAPIADLDMASAGFIAGVDRALAFERDKYGVDPAEPVRLVRWEDGRLSLIDPITGWRAELMGFGPDNLEAFARLLDTPGRQPTRQTDGDRP